MHLDTFHTLADAAGPFASVTLDVSRVDRAAEDDVDRRWRAVAESLTGLGVPDDLVDALGERARSETGRGGEWTRVVVATSPDTVQDALVPGRPVRDEGTWGPVPQLIAAVRGLAGLVRHAVVRIDRTGADIDLAGGAEPTHTPDNVHEVVEGGHDVVHKVPAGGWSQRRFQMRVEDSWERNAEAVAEALVRLVRAQHPEVVLVMGDVRAAGLLERCAAPELAERLVRLDTGGRAPGTSQTAEDEAVAAALAAHRAAREAALVDRFREQLSRQQDAVDGRDEVLQVLERGQADEVLMVDDLGSEATVTVDGARVPADAALVWAAVRTRAGITLVDAHQVELRDGVGALLRWSDQSTPHGMTPAMPGHGEAPGMAENPE
jgi:Bacterial archaeo-eukaryotic release factor family 2